MSFWLIDYRVRQEAAAKERTLRLTVALSLAVHLAAMLLVPHLRMGPLTSGDPLPGITDDKLRVQLASIPRPAAEPTPEPPRPIVAVPKPRAAPPPRTVARSEPVPVLTAPPAAEPEIAKPPPTPPTPAPVETRPPAEGDLLAYVQARRRERGEPSAATDQQADMRNANLAANLPSPATGVATRRQNHGGGMFELRRMDYDDAAFEFFGWNDEMGRKTPQMIEVRLGNNSDMRIAVVRKMIAIIREHSSGDFIWRSPHHVDGIVLSARVSDNAELESFLLQDFFDETRRMR